MMVDIIAFTCASGKQCSGIIPLLYPDSTKYRLRLVVHSDSSRERLTKEYPQAEVLQANLDDPADRAKIVKDVSVLYYVSPTFHPHETKLGQGMVDAACEEVQRPGSKFSHFVLSSVLHTHLRKMVHHDRKRYIEEYLCESPLQWTVLQASHFMDNSIGSILTLRGEHDPVYTAAHDPDIPFSFSCVHDHAEASAKVIKEGAKHYYATYQLVSTWPITFREYVRQLGEVIGKDIKIEQANYEDQVNSYCKLIFGRADPAPLYREGPSRMLLYYNERGLPGNPRIAEWVLGRPPTKPAEFAKMLLGRSGH